MRTSVQLRSVLGLLEANHTRDRLNFADPFFDVSSLGCGGQALAYWLVNLLFLSFLFYFWANSRLLLGWYTILQHFCDVFQLAWLIAFSSGHRNRFFCLCAAQVHQVFFAVVLLLLFAIWFIATSARGFKLLLRRWRWLWRRRLGSEGDFGFRRGVSLTCGFSTSTTCRLHIEIGR